MPLLGQNRLGTSRIAFRADEVQDSRRTDEPTSRENQLLRMIYDGKFSTSRWHLGLLVALGVLTSPAVLWGQAGVPGFGGGGGMPSPAGSKPPTYQPPVFERREPGELIVDVKITGNQSVSESRIRNELQTRVGRDFDPAVVQGDVRRLSSTGLFRNVQTFRRAVPRGVEVTFQVTELPTIRHLRFEGRDKIRESTLRKKAELKVGEPLNRYRVEEARRKLQELYVEKGFADAQVELVEGNKPEDQGVVFSIYEGPQQRFFHTRFLGNTIVSDARLRTQIQSKPGILWLFKGKVDREQIEADRDLLVAYYRSLGYFKARVGRYLDFSESGKWLTLTYVIDEGPRYQIRNVSLVGNDTFTTDSLTANLGLKPGDYFDSRKMNRDLMEMRDLYGSQGYIHADVKADPQFLEEPGKIDLVYDIREGEQYRVGRIIVNIEGDNPHTRRNVVINRLSLAPNDIIDIREIRASERRLRSAELFLSDPTRGISPTIAIRPPELTDGPRLVDRPSAGSNDASY